jgi:pSer/pThr/pTyr-binding forkhead associated (FHA) protein
VVLLKQIVNGTVVSEIAISEGDFTIGRNSGNSLQLEDSVVSGEHAVLTLKPSQYVPEWLEISIRDQNSTNGTYVNNAAVKEQDLRHGDMIRIGTYEFKVFDDKSALGTETLFHLPEA